MPDKYKYNSTQQAFSEKVITDDIDVVIGDEKNSGFKEEVKLSWNKEYSKMFDLSVRLNEANIFDTTASAKEISELNGKIISSSDIIKNEYSDIIENGIIVGKKHDTILFAKPKSNILEYSVKSKGLDLFEQKPLTDEYKAGWSEEHKCEIDVTETDVIDTKTGNILVHRPERIVNGFAIYNNQKAGRIIRPSEGSDVNYFNGKLGEIERKCAILPDGSKVWLKQAFDAKTGILTVTLPDSILKDESLFQKGLIIDPTFGYTTAGGTEWTNVVAAGDPMGCIYALSENGTVTDIRISARSLSGNQTIVRAGCWNDSSSYPNAEQSNNTTDTTFINSTKAWVTLNISSSFSINAGNYWLGLLVQTTTTNSLRIYYDAGGANQTRYKALSLSSLPNPFPASATGIAYNISIYATYTAGGGGSTFKPKTYFIN